MSRPRSGDQHSLEPSGNLSFPFIADLPVTVIRRVAALWYGGAMTAPSSSRRPVDLAIEAVRTRLGLLRKASTFAAVGIINTLVDFGVFMAAWKILGLPL